MPDTSAVPPHRAVPWPERAPYDPATSPEGAPYDAIILAGGRGSRLGGVDKAQVELAGAPLIDRPLAACATARRIVVVGPPSAVAHLRGSRERYAADSVTGSPADRVRVTREQPPGGGPAAATAAGLAALYGDAPETDPQDGGGRAPWVVLLSCDLPLAQDGVRRLLEAAAGPGAGHDGTTAASGGADGAGQDGPSVAAGDVTGRTEGGIDGYLLVDDDGRRQWLFGIYRADRLTAVVRRHPDPAGMPMRRLLDGLTLASVAESGDVSADLDTWDDHAAWTARLET